MKQCACGETRYLIGNGAGYTCTRCRERAAQTEPYEAQKERSAMKVPEKNAGGSGVDGYGQPFTPGTTFTPCPVGTKNAVCVDYVDMGMVATPVFGKVGETELVHKAKFIYQVAAKMPDGRPYLLAFKPFGVRVSLHEKAAFRQHLESFLGRPFEVGEEIEPEDFVGKPCVVIVTHSKNADGTKTYANIDGIGPHMDGLPVMKPEGYVRLKDREGAQAPAGAAKDEDPDADIPF